MKQRLLTAALALLLALLPSCTPAGNDDKTTDQTETTDTAVIDDPNILKNVYTERELNLDGDIIPSEYTDVYVKDGKLSLFGTKEVTVDERYVDEYYITTIDLETGAREDRRLDFNADRFHLRKVHVSDDVVLIIGTRYDDMTNDKTTALVKYNLADNTSVSMSGLEIILSLNKESYEQYTGLTADKDGNVYVSSNNEFCVFNSDLKEKFRGKSSKTIISLERSLTGEVYVTNVNSAYIVDVENNKLGESIPLPSGIKSEYITFAEGYDCYFANDDGYYGYKNGSTEAELIINWKNSNVLYDSFSIVDVISPDEIVIKRAGNFIDIMPTYSILEKSDDIDLTKIVNISVAYIDSIGIVPGRIVKFNKTNRIARAEGLDYGQYDNGENRATGAAAKLVTDMLTGVFTPDVICVPYVSSVVTQMLEKELYTDLYEFMEDDPDIHKDDIMGVVKNSYEIDGKLTLAMPSFRVESMLAPRSAVGDKTSWTYDDVLAFMDNLDEGEKLSQDAYDSLNLYYAFDTFIDYENKTCDFNNPTCVKLIEKYVELEKYKEQAYEYSRMNPDEYITSTEQGDSVCYNVTYDYLDEYQLDAAIAGTDDFVRIGYPTENGNGSRICSGYAYIIPKNAPHPKEAWDFIRSAILDKPDYDVIGGNEPRMLRSQNEAYGEDMKNYWKFIPFDRSKTKFITAKITGNPEDLLDENGMLDGRAGTLVLYDEEDYMEFLDFLDNASSPVTERIPAELHDIIFEEIDAYKKGSRTAEKTAEIIQSRVSIYLSERE